VRALPALLLLLAACGAAPPRDPLPPSPPRATTPRDLAPDATFADLASAARRQDDLRDQESDAGCLVRLGADGLRLEADLAVAVRPLPAPEADLDARLEADSGPIRVLTRFGAYGTQPARVALVAMTTSLPPTRGTALALFVTDRGVYARRSDRSADDRTPSRPEWIAEHAPWAEFDLVAVSAEAGTPVRAVIDLLDRLPASLAGRIALAVALADGTALPQAQAPAEGETAAVCAEGLPELAESDPIGDLAPDRILAGIEPLRRAAELCVGTSTGAGAAGGRVAITVRIGPDGRVPAACVSEDSTGDAALRACLVRAARELSFDPPGGYVDFALPLALESGRAQRQSAVCR
jgi:hypothetical protein